MKTATDVITRFLQNAEGDIETIAFKNIMAQGGKIDVKDGGSTFEFFDGSIIYTDSNVIGLCYNSQDEKQGPIRWSGDKSMFDWDIPYVVYPMVE